jgi:hypothetical protein
MQMPNPGQETTDSNGGQFLPESSKHVQVKDTYQNQRKANGFAI